MSCSYRCRYCCDATDDHLQIVSRAVCPENGACGRGIISRSRNVKTRGGWSRAASAWLGWKKRGSGLRSAITSEELMRLVGAMCVSICIHACLPTPFSIQASLYLCGPLPPFLSSLPLQTHSYLMMLSNEQPNLQYSTNLPQGNPDTLLSELMHSSLFSVLSPWHSARRQRNPGRRKGREGWKQRLVCAHERGWGEGERERWELLHTPIYKVHI